MKTIDKRRAYSEKRAVWLRNYQRARARALTRLAQQYPDQYKELLEQERLADESMAKTWLDITGATSISSSLGVLTDRNNDTSGSEETNGDEQDEGNVGGEG